MARTLTLVLVLSLPAAAAAQETFTFPVSSTTGWGTVCGGDRGSGTRNADLSMSWTDTTEAATADISLELVWKFLCVPASYEVRLNDVRLAAGTNASSNCVCNASPFQTTTQTFLSAAINPGGKNTLVIRNTSTGYIGLMNNASGWLARVVVTPPANLNPTISAVQPTDGGFVNRSRPTFSALVTPPEDREHAVAQFAVDGGAYVDGSQITTSGRSELTSAAALTEGGHTLLARARDLRGGVSGEVSVDFTVDSTPPSVTASSLLAPNGGELLAGGALTTITWTAPTDAHLGENPISLFYSVNGGGSFVEIARDEANDGIYDWLVPKVDSGKVLLRLVVVDLAGNTGADVSDAPLRIDSTAPSVPGVPKPATDATSGTVSLTWKASTDTGGSGVASYEVEFSGDGGGSTNPLDRVPVPAATHAAPEGRFVYRVRAIDAAGNASAWSPWSVEVVVDVTPPSTPGTPTATPNPDPTPGGPIVLSWTAATDGGGSRRITYLVERANGSSEDWLALGSAAGTSSVDAPSAGRYRYRVSARDEAGNTSPPSAPSLPVLVTTPPVASQGSFQGKEDEDIQILLRGTDAEGDPLTWTVVGAPVNGLLSGTGDRRTYRGKQDFVGQDTFVVQASDGVFPSNLAVITVDVLPVNDAPVFVAPLEDDVVSAHEGDELVYRPTAMDVDSTELRFSAEGLPEGAQVDEATGTITFTPAWSDGGAHEVHLTVSDGLLSTTVRFTLDVTFIDADEDGAPDTHEPDLGLDPTSPDSDGDSITDGQELGDPRDPTDTDGDGTIDALDDDSDDDGVADADEAGDTDLLTPPASTADGDMTPDFRDRDSDDDGVDDGTDVCRTVADPDQKDIDGDGIGDACDESANPHINADTGGCACGSGGGGGLAVAAALAMLLRRRRS